MKHYTDEDVQTVARTLYAETGAPEDFATLAPSFRARYLTDARVVLHIAAPAIAARAKREALREYAQDLEANGHAATWEWDDFVVDAREYAESFRADEIESRS